MRISDWSSDVCSSDLWRILEQYFKPYPVCRWAQPAIEAAAGLLRHHAVRPERIASVRIETFPNAVRLGTRLPATAAEAQYPIGFPVAPLIVRGRLGTEADGAGGLADPDVAARGGRPELNAA